MSTELSILALYGIVLVVVILVQILSAQSQVGLAMLIGPRDDMPELTGVPGRIKRATENSVVAMALFAPAILLLHATGGFSANSLLAAQAFLVARVLYVPIYAAGTPWLRTIVWLVGFLATLWLYVMAL